MKTRLLLLPLIALAGALGLSRSARAEPPPPAIMYTVNVGGGGSGIAANGFFPSSIVIHKGDTIRFTNPYEELHTTTFLPPGGAPSPVLIPDPSGSPGFVLNPVVANPTDPGAVATTLDPTQYYNSGLMFKGSSVDIVFNTLSENGPGVTSPNPDAGAFTFICQLHPGMTLKVKVVQATPTTGLLSPADVAKAGVTERDAIIAQGQAIAKDARLTKTTSGSGAATWNLLAGQTQGRADVMQFLPQGPVNINVGDTVKWTSVVDTPHTVTFLSGAAAPGLVVPSGGNLAINPAVALPAGGPTYDGTGIANSGIMDRSGQVPGGSSYSLTFTKPGTYTYICLLHADQGMAGTIVVAGASTAPPPSTRPATAPITAPNTGSGPPASVDGRWGPALAIVALLGASMLVAGVRWARASRAGERTA